MPDRNILKLDSFFDVIVCGMRGGTDMRVHRCLV
jgi:hypothetical protein